MATTALAAATAALADLVGPSLLHVSADASAHSTLTLTLLVLPCVLPHTICNDTDWTPTCCYRLHMTMMNIILRRLSELTEFILNTGSNATHARRTRILPAHHTNANHTRTQGSLRLRHLLALAVTFVMYFNLPEIQLLDLLFVLVTPFVAHPFRWRRRRMLSAIAATVPRPFCHCRRNRSVGCSPFVLRPLE